MTHVLKNDIGIKPVVRYPLDNGASVFISKGSVVDFKGDAIVNAANIYCIGGGGVDGAISQAGGPALHLARKNLPTVQIVDEQCRSRDGYRMEKRKRKVRCQTGDAVITSGDFGRLRVRHVIHAVGPNYNIAEDTAFYNGHDTVDYSIEDELLASAYSESVHRAKEVGAKSMAFSLLSFSLYAGNRNKADISEIAFDALKRASYPGAEIHLVCFTDSELKLLLDAAPRVFTSTAERVICTPPKDYGEHAPPRITTTQSF